MVLVGDGGSVTALVFLFERRTDMSLVTERRTSLELTGEPSVLHNPANLPYEAVRRAWWAGFQSAVLTIVITLLMIVAAVAIIKDGMGGKSSTSRVPNGAPEISEPYRDPADAAPGVGPRVPGNAYDPSEESKELDDGTPVEINPVFPDLLPADEPGRNTPPPIPLSHDGDRAVEGRDLLAALRAQERIERIAPVRRITMNGRCCGLHS
jgi:hypothetical protein